MSRKRRTPDDFHTYDTHGSDYSTTASDSESDSNTMCLPLMNTIVSAAGVGHAAQNSRSMGSSSMASPSHVPSASIARKKTSPTEAEKVIVRELNELSLQERNKLNEEVHGITEKHDETEEFLSKRLESLEYEIHKTRPRTAYDMAMFLSPAFVQDRGFRLMFLRADRYDTKKAAQRIIEHFRCKEEWFGRNLLVSQITWHDLTEDDVECLTSGGLQFNPSMTDNIGRCIVYDSMERIRYKANLNRLRVGWYLMMLACRNENVQRNGLVVVANRLGSNASIQYNIELGHKMSMQSRALPLRIIATHFCFDDRRIRPLISMAQLTLTQESRLRFRSHFGSQMECQYMVMSFGVPESLFQNESVAKFLNYIDETKQKEADTIEEAKKEGRIDNPRETDIVMGRGKPFINFPGNKAVQSLINDSFRIQYRNLGSRDEKTVMSEAVLQMIKDKGIRFLKRDVKRGTWIQVDSMTAREKVSNILRMKPSVQIPLLRMKSNGGWFSG